MNEDFIKRKTFGLNLKGWLTVGYSIKDRAQACRVLKIRLTSLEVMQQLFREPLLSKGITRPAL